MFILIKSRPELKMGHAVSKTRPLGQILEKTCVHSRRHSFDPINMKLCPNVYHNERGITLKLRYGE